MKTKLLIKLNILLAAIITLLVGCKTQQVNKSDDVVADDQPSVTEPSPERMICLYGIPPEVYRRLHPEDSTQVE